MTDTVKEWGPEIKVDGKRPEWLGDRQPFRWYSAKHNPVWHDGEVMTADRYCVNSWHWIEAIRLPADHPYYRRQVAKHAATSDDLTARMEALVREVARRDDSLGDDARAIVALLPEVVDGDLVEARKIAASARGMIDPDCILKGERDDREPVQLALAAIRRGRELQKGKGA